jgi:hypothetical protein
VIGGVMELRIKCEQTRGDFFGQCWIWPNRLQSRSSTGWAKLDRCLCEGIETSRWRYIEDLIVMTVRKPMMTRERLFLGRGMLISSILWLFVYNHHTLKVTLCQRGDNDISSEWCLERRHSMCDGDRAKYIWQKYQLCTTYLDAGKKVGVLV